MLDVATFVCDRRCGECCKRLTVVVSPSDITRIEALGHSDFVKFSGDVREGRVILKHSRNGWCVFLKQDVDGLYGCSIHDSRPEVCRKYPFFGDPISDCRPKVFGEGGSR
jgi:hypothetical protein